jgi:hypothetical protein
MPGVSMVCAAACCTAGGCSDEPLQRRPWRAITRPGLVQNWPAPWVSEATNLAPVLRRGPAAASNRNTGLIELISAYTGIGSGRAWRPGTGQPPLREPVKPTALIRGSLTRAMPTSRPEPYSSETRLRAGRTASPRATAWPTSSLVPGWALCALTTTGQPAASAEAVSPPATEKASGKLLAPNTATGPRGSGAGAGRHAAAAGARAGPVDPHIQPFAGTYGTGKGAQLAAGAATFALHACLRQAGFGHGAVDQRIAQASIPRRWFRETAPAVRARFRGRRRTPPRPARRPGPRARRCRR